MDYNFETEVPFDPGFSPMVIHFSSTMDAAMGIISQLKSPHQKKFKFKVLYPQLIKAFENIVSFYAGCLLWASFIKNMHPDKKISGNSFYKQDTDKYDFMYEINYLLDYFEKFDRDCKYYLNQPSKLPQEWKQITELYKDFLSLNNNFYDSEYAKQILLPNKLKNFSTEEQNINFELIKESIEKKQLPLLLQKFI